MKWITREKIQVDRVACPGSSKDLSIPTRNFCSCLGTPTGQGSMMESSSTFRTASSAITEKISFNSILKKYDLSGPALGLLGEIVRAADSHPANPHPLEKVCAGLLATSAALD
jgi:hypothetical protein